MTNRLLSTGLAALAAGAAWLTPGAQAVVDATTRTRVGVLPPWWILTGLLLIMRQGSRWPSLPASRWRAGAARC